MKSIMVFRIIEAAVTFQAGLQRPYVQQEVYAARFLNKRRLYRKSYSESSWSERYSFFQMIQFFLKEQIQYLNVQDFAVIDTKVAGLFQDEIRKASRNLDSVGGILQTAVVGFPSGVENRSLIQSRVCSVICYSPFQPSRGSALEPDLILPGCMAMKPMTPSRASMEIL